MLMPPLGVELADVDDEQLRALIREAFRLMKAKDTASRPAKSSKFRRAV